MGQAIEKLAEHSGHEVVLRISADTADALTVDHLRQADVAVEFTSPESAVGHILLCFRAGVPVVSGTTGWLADWSHVLAERSKHEAGFFYASNFSIGVNITFAVNKLLARLMNDQPDYAIRLEEVHHTGKLDAPSGTAIALAEDILALVERKTGWVEASARDAEDIPIVWRREADVPGTHEVRYRSAIDTITLRHEAHSREGFARGALLAAEWMVGKKGHYGMSDLLGF